MAEATEEVDSWISKPNITRTGSCRVLIACIQHLLCTDTMQNSVQMTCREYTHLVQ
jgi:hypothetical protein